WEPLRLDAQGFVNTLLQNLRNRSPHLANLLEQSNPELQAEGLHRLFTLLISQQDAKSPAMLNYTIRQLAQRYPLTIEEYDTIGEAILQAIRDIWFETNPISSWTDRTTEMWQILIDQAK